MNILITGATGLIGQKLIELLLQRDKFQISVLTTDKAKAISRLDSRVKTYEWNPDTGHIEATALSDKDIVINLAGDNIGKGSWTEKKMSRILNSRVNSTRLLVEEIRKQKTPPKKFISASAAAIYSEGFLTHVCQAWESQASIKIRGMQTTILRLGVVLSIKGGMLRELLLLFKLGLGATMGSGKQMISWIDEDDLMRVFLHLIDVVDSSGVYDAVSPNSVSNYNFTKALGGCLKVPTIFRIPSAIVTLLFGKKSEIILTSTCPGPTRLQKEGFKFKYPTIEESLNHLFYL